MLDTATGPAPGTDPTPIPGFAGYFVARDGSVWSYRAKRFNRGAPTWRRLKPMLSSHGYHVVSLRPDGEQKHNGKPKTLYVHHLVLEVFVGPRPSGTLACHANDLPTDNRVENLRWDTPSANNADAKRNGRVPMGENAPGAKLTDRDVEVARYLLDRGVRRELVAVVFDVSAETIGRIENREEGSRYAV